MTDILGELSWFEDTTTAATTRWCTPLYLVISEYLQHLLFSAEIIYRQGDKRVETYRQITAKTNQKQIVLPVFNIRCYSS
jgi:hypothetical protein